MKRTFKRILLMLLIVVPLLLTACSPQTPAERLAEAAEASVQGTAQSANQGIPSTPEGFFTFIADFLKSLFSGGSASWDSLYWITPLFYLFIFGAIWYEGVRVIPVFGRRGEINAAGKWFVAGATGLSTLGIFVGEQVAGKTARQIVGGLITPFGVWGALFIALFIGLIFFKWIRDSGIFGDHILLPVATAVSIGAITAGWLLSYSYLFSWGFVIALIGAAVGLIMKFAKSKKESAELGEEGLEKGFWGNIRKKKKSGAGSWGGKGKSGRKAKIKERAKKSLEIIKKFAQLEFTELNNLKKNVNNAPGDGGLKTVAKKDLKQVQRTEARADRRIRKFNRIAKKLKDDLIYSGKGDELKAVKKILKKLKVDEDLFVAVLSNGGILEKTLTTKSKPKGWNDSFFGTFDNTGNTAAKKKNAIAVIDQMVKWDQAYYDTLQELQTYIAKLK